MKKWVTVGSYMGTDTEELTFPLDPLTQVDHSTDIEMRRRNVAGVLESYHGNYDVLSEGVQNAVDAIEDAENRGLSGPRLIEVTINLAENWLSIFDTGVGMGPSEVAGAFAPQVTFKHQYRPDSKNDKRKQHRGYKGVGLTFLAYGTDEIIIHSKRADTIQTKAKMQYGRAWAKGERKELAQLVKDGTSSPLDRHSHGTYILVKFSKQTSPKSLSMITTSPQAWRTVLRTKTAIGQVLLGCSQVVNFTAKLKVITDAGESELDVIPLFLYPHTVERTPPFRFLDLVDYYAKNAEQTKPPVDKLRQDGIYLTWEAERISKALTEDQRTKYADQIIEFLPSAYAFVPYQNAVWADLHKIETGATRRTYIAPGLMIAVNRQRLADISEIKATRFENFGKNVMVLVHFHGVHSDQGRKTIEDQAEALARDIADRIVQYLGTQKDFLKKVGEASPTPEQRQIEKSHADWQFNVRLHAKESPLYSPPITYSSTPLTEQDVVGLFHQLSALGVFPGIRIYATSANHTYDCLIDFDCPIDTPGLLYRGVGDNPLGVSHFVLGALDQFSTKQLTLEFKNNLDSLIEDIGRDDSPKTFSNIDICVCWSQLSTSFKGYELSQVTEAKIEEREYPGFTHLLTHDGSAHVIGVVMLKTVMAMISAGHISIPLKA